MPYPLGNFPVYAQGSTVGSVTVSQNGLLTVFDCACRCRSREIMRLAAVCGGRYVMLGVPAPGNVPVADEPASDDGALLLKKSFSKKALGDLGFDEPESFHLIRAEDTYNAPPSGAVPEAMEPPESEEPPGPAFLDTPPEQEKPEEQQLPPEETDTEPEVPDWHPTAETEDSAKPVKAAVEEAPDIDGWTQISTPGYIFSDPTVAEACAGVTGALMTVQEDYLSLAVPVSSQEPFPLMAVFCFGSSAEIGGREYIVFKVRDGNLIL